MKTKPPYKISFFIMIGGLDTAKPGASNSQCGTLGIHYLISVHIFSMKSVQESASQIHRLLAISDVGHCSGNNASPIRFKLHISYIVHIYIHIQLYMYMTSYIFIVGCSLFSPLNASAALPLFATFESFAPTTSTVHSPQAQSPVLFSCSKNLLSHFPSAKHSPFLKAKVMSALPTMPPQTAELVSHDHCGP